MYHALHTKTTQADPPERATLSTAVESSRTDSFRMQTALSPGWMNSGGKRTQQESSVQVLEGEGSKAPGWERVVCPHVLE